MHSSRAGFFGRIALFFFKIEGPFSSFYSPHGLSILKRDSSALSRNLFLIIERILAVVDGGTFLACSMSEASEAQLNIKHRNIVCIPNGIDLKKIIDVDSAGDEIISVGRICPQKNPLAFLYLAEKFVEDGYKFCWIGGGEMEREFAIRSNGLINIEAQMDHDSIFSRLKSAHIFVLTSLWEGMPVALIEAQASGIPAVVLDAVGSRDVVIDGITGFICKTVVEMEGRIRELMTNKDLWGAMSHNSKLYSQRNFDIQTMHSRLLYAYESGMNKNLSSY